MNFIKKPVERLIKGTQAVHFLPGLLTRIAIGSVFIESGWGKLTHLSKVIEFFVSLGIPGAHIQAPMVAGLEFFCGVLVLLGLGTRLASIPLIAIMAVAIRTAKWEDIAGFTSVFGVAEALYIVLLLWLVIAGAGKLSLDFLIQKQCSCENLPRGGSAGSKAA